MKLLFSLTTCAFLWYIIVSFTLYNVHIETWHWTARALYLTLTVLAFDRVKNK